MKYSNLFIVGAPKSGTTFLFEKLKEHPDIFMPRIKELNHFSFKYLNERSYYKDYKIESRQKYLKQYENASNQKYLMDGSVSYFAFEDIPKQIAEFNSKAKLIIILRDPYQRAYSHYLMDLRMKYADKSFEYYLTRNDFHKEQYIGNSLYFRNISNYLKYFNEKQILILQLEKLEEQLPTLFQFLDIEDIASNINTKEKVNPNKAPKNFVASYFQKNRAITEKLKLIIPKLIISFFNSFLYSTKLEKSELTQKEKELLHALLDEDIQQLKEWNPNLDYTNV